jgi:hypothetical protein
MLFSYAIACYNVAWTAIEATMKSWISNVVPVGLQVATKGCCELWLKTFFLMPFRFSINIHLVVHQCLQARI